MRTRRIQQLEKAKPSDKRPCNLCGQPFIMRTKFSRFCGECKSEKTVYRFAEWLPNLSIAV